VRSISADATYQFDYAYNSLGQLDTLTWPTSTSGVRFKAKYGYTGGRLTSVQDYTGNVNGTVLWTLNLLDAGGRAISETYGNGLWLQNAYHPLTGEPVTRRSGTGGSENNVQDLLYAWDAAGNLTARQDLRQGLVESFTHDALNRLSSVSGPGGQSLTIQYLLNGNIQSRTDLGSYTYHATKKHAVTAAGSNSYSYDANGNMITRNGASLAWTSYNLPSSVSAASYSAQFAYGPERARWRQISSYANGTETTIYVGGLLEKLTTAARTHWKHLIATPSGQVQVIRRSDGTNEVLYVATDHLGSTDAVVNAAATVASRESFSVFGARRSSTWQGAPSSTEWQAIIDTSRRGFTGHEHLDNVSLIHMNGRVYDPALGRFTSADPLIDGVFNSQGWNRYAYVHNRPLSATDPTGYSGTNTVQCVADARSNGFVTTTCFRTVYFDIAVPISGGRFVEPARPASPTGQISDAKPSEEEGEQSQEDNWLCSDTGRAATRGAAGGVVLGGATGGASGALVGAAAGAAIGAYSANSRLTQGQLIMGLAALGSIAGLANHVASAAGSARIAMGAGAVGEVANAGTNSLGTLGQYASGFAVNATIEAFATWTISGATRGGLGGLAAVAAMQAAAAVMDDFCD
jgi:RHS repeat-associated protein